MIEETLYNVSDAFVRYLQLLHSSSTRFQSKRDEIRKKYFPNGELFPEQRSDFDVDDTEAIDEIDFYMAIAKRIQNDGVTIQLAKDFYIPPKEENIEYLSRYLFYDTTIIKYHLRDYSFLKKGDAVQPRPITQPKIILEITDQINESELRDLWKKKLEGKMKKLRKSRKAQSREKMDDYLEIYRLNTEEKLTPKEIFEIGGYAELTYVHRDLGFIRDLIEAL